MNKDLKESPEIPCIHIKNHIAYRVSISFLQLTGYSELDVMGKSVNDIGRLLKSEYQLFLQDITDKQCAYIFTSDNIPVEVEISVVNENNTVYYFKEQKNIALEFMLDNFANDPTEKRESEAIFSYPECILLKHDENYIDTLHAMDRNSEQLVGKQPSLSPNIIELFKKGMSFHKLKIQSISVNGVETYWNIHVKMIREDGRKKYFAASFYDKTDKVNEREIIKRQRSEMELILDNMSDIVNILDKDGNYTYINKAGIKALEPYTPKYIRDLQSVTSRMTYDAFTTGDIPANILPFEDTAEQRVLRGEKLTDYMISGTSDLPTAYYVCDGIPFHDKQGNIDGAIIVYKNLESAYKIEEYKALQENEEDISIYYATLSPEDFKIISINEPAFKTVKEKKGYLKTELDVIGKKFFELIDFKNIDELIRGINQSVENKTSYVHQNDFMYKGKKIYTKSVFQPAFNKNGEIEKIIVLGIDISDEVRITKEIKKQLTVQEELFINISHELNTPLSVIFSGAQLLNLYLEKDSLEDVRDDISNINTTTIGNCHRLIKLINNILDISKIESGLYELNLRNYNIVKVIDDIVESVSEFTKLKNIQLIFDTEVEELVIALDGYKFDRILLNLISNAIKFSITGEVILIKLVEKNDQTISISITDQGIGIAPHNIEDIFQKYTQVNRDLNRISEGTGLGLPLARSMAELHGGSLRVESALGRGSTFTIELPIRMVDAVSVEEDANSVHRAEIIKYEFSDIYL